MLSLFWHAHWVFLPSSCPSLMPRALHHARNPQHRSRSTGKSSALMKMETQTWDGPEFSFLSNISCKNGDAVCVASAASLKLSVSFAQADSSCRELPLDD